MRRSLSPPEEICHGSLRLSAAAHVGDLHEEDAAFALHAGGNLEALLETQRDLAQDDAPDLQHGDLFSRFSRFQPIETAVALAQVGLDAVAPPEIVLKGAARRLAPGRGRVRDLRLDRLDIGRNLKPAG